MNDKPFTKHWLVFLVAFFALILDGSLDHMLGGLITHGVPSATPMTFLLVFVFMAVYVPREKWMIWQAILLGLIYDSYYDGIIGVHMLILPLIIYVVLTIRDAIPRTWPFMLGMFIIALTAWTFMDYLAALFTSATNISIITMITQHLAPNINLNVILFAILYYPCSRLLVKLNS